jgi:uncharacterized protein (TIGR03435 family)
MRLTTLILLTLFCATPLIAQQRQFDVVSIRENTSGDAPTSNFPLNPGPQYNNAGGLLVAHSTPILQLLVFAYAKSMLQIQDLRRQLPEWARTSRWDIQARADGTATKDEMRAMTRALLEDRFHLKLHTETRDTAVYKLVLVHDGKLGPRLNPHPPDAPACAEHGPYGSDVAVTIAGGLPAYCGFLVGLPGAPQGDIRVGGRAVTMASIALGIGGTGGFDRQIIDGTNLPGTYDLMVDFSPATPDPAHAAELSGTPIEQALAAQLGLKLQNAKAPVETYAIDRFEKPTAN